LPPSGLKIDASPSSTSNQSFPSASRQHVAEGRGAPVVFVRRHDQTTVGQVDCLLDDLESGKHCRLIGAIEIAGKNFTNRDADLPDCFAERFRQILALLVEIALFGDIVEIDGDAIGLIRERRAVPDNNDISTGTQRLDESFGVAGQTLWPLRRRWSDQGHQAHRHDQTANGSS
jgi:hypothetical protein